MLKKPERAQLRFTDGHSYCPGRALFLLKALETTHAIHKEQRKSRAQVYSQVHGIDPTFALTDQVVDLQINLNFYGNCLINACTCKVIRD
ncbi:hypothetical protein JKG68_27750 [Microvirga aerilata]|uniref:Uncharacterized protein n=1 Tax=Microvirga aerilata TaxID=670292 RepID=A0A936ZN26_9HYPH|nr:hypothetical protein [Microvirga aerilata]MBL0407709.1 hypothetical protein [Microvirga aerilata]